MLAISSHKVVSQHVYVVFTTGLHCPQVAKNSYCRFDNIVALKYVIATQNGHIISHANVAKTFTCQDIFFQLCAYVGFYSMFNLTGVGGGMYFKKFNHSILLETHFQ